MPPFARFGLRFPHRIRGLVLLVALVGLLITAATFALLGRGAAASKPAESSWVRLGKDQRLVYRKDERGNRILDFSHAGYGGGGVALPRVKTARKLGPAPGDDTARIQAAIDAVSALGPDAQGFRGAVELGPGTYELEQSLSIAASGVVLRAGGSGARGTVLQMRGRPHRLLSIRGAGSRETEGEPVPIVDAYLPSGATRFRVAAADAGRFEPGDTVLVRRPVTEAWIRLMKMDKLERNGKRQTWLEPGDFIDSERTIKTVKGATITLDVPLTDSFDARILAPARGTVQKIAFPGRIQKVGFEGFRVRATPEGEERREHRLLGINAAMDVWVRDIVVEGTRDGISIGSTARRVTLERVHIHHRETEPHTGGASPADIAISGTQVLLDRCRVRGTQVWPVVTQARVTGPIVVLNFEADEAGVSPHQRWATGLLVDGGVFHNNREQRPGVALGNRAHAGSGHGWSAGWSVAWNVKSRYLLVQQPPGAANWAIGCAAKFATVLWDGSPLADPCLPSDKIESIGASVEPRSLYLQQLRERLGPQAVANIGYRP